MHVLVATDGELDAQKGADFAVRLAGQGGKVTVLTAVEIPRSLIGELRSAYGSRDEILMLDRETVDVRPTGSVEGSGWPGDDAMLDRYIHDVTEERTAPLVAALKEAGVDPEVAGVEAETAAPTIIAEATSRGADVICVGSHGKGRFEGFLGSVSQRVSRLAPCPVLVIR